MTPEREEALRLIRKGIDAEPFMLGTHTAAHEALRSLAADLEAAERERDEAHVLRDATVAKYREEAALNYFNMEAERQGKEHYKNELVQAERERDEAIQGQANIEFRRLQEEIRRLREGWDGWQKQALAAERDLATMREALERAYKAEDWDSSLRIMDDTLRSLWEKGGKRVETVNEMWPMEADPSIPADPLTGADYPEGK